MITVKATREGLVGGLTASGYVVDRVVSFVALPDTRALHRHVRLLNPANGRTTIAEVLDVGPWNEHDHAYVFQPATMRGAAAIPASTEFVRPGAESGFDTPRPGRPRRKTNHAGIDLGERVYAALEMTGNGLVSWEFV